MTDPATGTATMTDPTAACLSAPGGPTVVAALARPSAGPTVAASAGPTVTASTRPSTRPSTGPPGAAWPGQASS